MKYSLLLINALIIIGCASIGTKFVDQVNKIPPLDPELSRVYIYNHLSTGLLDSFSINLNGKKIAKLGRHESLYIDLSPGQYEITAGKDIDIKKKFNMSVNKGDVRYLEATWQDLFFVGLKQIQETDAIIKMQDTVFNGAYKLSDKKAQNKLAQEDENSSNKIGPLKDMPKKLSDCLKYCIEKFKDKIHKDDCKEICHARSEELN